MCCVSSKTTIMISHSNTTFPIIIFDVTWRLPFFQWYLTLFVNCCSSLSLFTAAHWRQTSRHTNITERIFTEDKDDACEMQWLHFLSVSVHLSGRESDKVMHDGRVHEVCAREIKYRQIEENAEKKFSKCFFWSDSCWDIVSLRNRFAQTWGGTNGPFLPPAILYTISCQLSSYLMMCASVVVTHLPQKRTRQQ